MASLRERWQQFAADGRVRVLAAVAGGLLVLSLVFLLGVIVGARQSFRALGAPFVAPFILRSISGEVHAAVGPVTEIGTGELTLMDSRLGQPQVVRFSSTTPIERGRNQRVQVSDLHVGDYLVVIGVPESGAVRARLIRVVSVLSTPDEQ